MMELDKFKKKRQMAKSYVKSVNLLLSCANVLADYIAQTPFQL